MVWHSVWTYRANQHQRLKTPWWFNMFNLITSSSFKWHSASGTLSALHCHPLAKPVRGASKCTSEVYLLQFLHASNKKQSRFIPCGKWIHANNLKTSKNQSTNPQTLNPLQKKCVQLRPAARTAVRDWNVICSRKHVFIVCLWACRCLCFEEAGPTQEHSQCPPSAQRRTHYFSWFLCDSPPGLYITVQRSSQPHILVQILQIGQVVADAFVIGRQYFSQLSFSVNSSDPWGWSSQNMSKTTRPLWAVARVARACAVSKAALPWPKIITAFPSKGITWRRTQRLTDCRNANDSHDCWIRMGN